MVHRLWLSALLGVALAACSTGAAPSHASGIYQGRLTDDVLYEASTTVIVTKRDVIVALDCSASDQRAVDAGLAVRLPAHVTLYTTPFSSAAPPATPTVVTDDKYAGKLCTPDSYDVVKP